MCKATTAGARRPDACHLTGRQRYLTPKIAFNSHLNESRHQPPEPEPPKERQGGERERGMEQGEGEEGKGRGRDHRTRTCGFQGVPLTSFTPVAPRANSTVFVLPSTIHPACFKAVTKRPAGPVISDAPNREPLVIGIPSTA